MYGASRSNVGTGAVKMVKNSSKVKYQPIKFYFGARGLNSSERL